MFRKDSSGPKDPDAIVVGGGAAGLTTSVRLAMKGKTVVLIEKACLLGGSSVLATSGINGVPTKYQPVKGDRVQTLINDTLNAGTNLCNHDLVTLMATRSSNAIYWLSSIGTDLLEVFQLEGHSMPRTHRGCDRVLPGYSLISSLVTRVEQSNKITVLLDSTLSKIYMDNGLFSSIEVITNDNEPQTLTASNLVIATGGYAADTESIDSLVKQYRPDLINLPTTNVDSVRGDGQKIVARDCNVKLIDMDQIQISPTAFIDMDSNQINSNSKTLCAGLLRDIGAILISPNTGKRFVNETTTRIPLYRAIFANCEINHSQFTKAQKYFSLIIVDSEDVSKAQTHINHYIDVKLLQKGTIKDIVTFVNPINNQFSESILQNTFQRYKDDMKTGDEFGRKIFGSCFDSGIYYYGFVTPVSHFSMGGIAFNENGQVISNSGNPIENIYSVGEVSGGVHGRDRLGGNSLLECIVFGLAAADNI